MRCTLMHKAIPVAELTLDSRRGNILSVDTLRNKAYLPVGIKVINSVPNQAKLAEWWASRSIPFNRPGLRSLLKRLNMPTALALSRECHGLSLSDQYWIRPKSSGLLWEDINFFHNRFSEDVGDILFGGEADPDQIDMMSPDSTTDGRLQKRWITTDGTQVLLKGGRSPFHQEPLNEALASVLEHRLGIPHVNYSVTRVNDLPYSVCENFITPRTELVTAYQICETKPFPEGGELYEHYLDCCDTLGIHGIRESLDQMLVLDYLIANTDRHYGNFGAIRDADTLEWISPAPLFDNGSSMWCGVRTASVNAYANTRSETFYQYHNDQLNLVTSFDWLDFSALNGIEDEFAEILAVGSDIDAERRRALCSALRQRIGLLNGFIQEK